MQGWVDAQDNHKVTYMTERAVANHTRNTSQPASCNTDNGNTEHEDRALLLRLKGASAEASMEAFLSLHDKYHPAMLRFVRSKISNPDDAEDIVQETWLVVLDKIFLFEWRDKPLKTWLFNIAHYKCLEFLRKNEAHVVFDETVAQHQTAVFAQKGFRPLEHVPNGPKTTATSAAPHEAQALMLDAVRALTELQHSIIRLKYFEGIETLKEIAQLLGQKYSTIRVNHRRAVRKLEAHPGLKQQYGELG